MSIQGASPGSRKLAHGWCKNSHIQSQDQARKKSRYTDQQIAYAMAQAEAGTPEMEILHRKGVRIDRYRLRTGEVVYVPDIPDR